MESSIVAGSVVLVRFPFSDLSRSKLRPALVIASVGYDDWILCQITSRPYSDPRAVFLSDHDFQLGSLQRDSFIRPGKIFTANASLFNRSVGQLKRTVFATVVDAVVEVVRSGF
ncbi:type II toxin-antitoxin system PemK/MazF family toxin [Magnetococcales bacterium HHB-1]